MIVLKHRIGKRPKFYRARIPVSNAVTAMEVYMLILKKMQLFPAFIWCVGPGRFWNKLHIFLHLELTPIKMIHIINLF